jgi:membrane protease YdiL (CAAX protease family)
MPFLTFLIGPAIAPVIGVKVVIARWLMIIVGMAWLFVISMIVLRCELGTLQWSVIRKRMWYQTPRDPKTGEPKLRLLWWALPGALLGISVDITPLGSIFQEAFLTVFPSLRPWAIGGGDLLSPEFVGQWWIVGAWLVSWLFNYFLGEEFFFRGVLLPKMKGVFSRWDWFVNVLLFAFWHWHQPWGIMTTIFSLSFAGWASRRYQCNWIYVIAHGFIGVVITVMLVLFVSGLAS